MQSQEIHTSGETQIHGFHYLLTFSEQEVVSFIWRHWIRQLYCHALVKLASAS